MAAILATNQTEASCLLLDSSCLLLDSSLPPLEFESRQDLVVSICRLPGLGPAGPGTAIMQARLRRISKYFNVMDKGTFINHFNCKFRAGGALEVRTHFQIFKII